MLSVSVLVELIVMYVAFVLTTAFVLDNNTTLRASPSGSDVAAVRKVSIGIWSVLIVVPAPNAYAVALACGAWLFVNETFNEPDSIKNVPPARSLVKPLSLTANLSSEKFCTAPLNAGHE